MNTNRHVAAAAERLLAADWPDGVTAEAVEAGVALSGAAIRHRFATEPDLRATVQAGARR